MTPENFYIEKKRVEELVGKRIKDLSSVTNEGKSLERVLEILSEYRFENRLEMKGVLTRTIIDSLELDYSIGEELISFDERIR